MDDIGCLTATALKSSVAVRKATCRIPSEAVRKRSILFVRNIGEVYARRKWDKTHKHRLGNSSISMIFYILRNYEKGKKPQLFKQFSFMDDNPFENLIRGEVGVVVSEPRYEALSVELSWENKLLEKEVIDVYIPRLGITVCVLFTIGNAYTL